MLNKKIHLFKNQKIQLKSMVLPSLPSALPTDKKQSTHDAVMNTVKKVLLNYKRYNHLYDDYEFEKMNAAADVFFKSRSTPYIQWVMTYVDKKSKKTYTADAVFKQTNSIGQKLKYYQKLKTDIQFQIKNDRQQYRILNIKTAKRIWKRNTYRFDKVGGVYYTPSRYLNLWIEHNGWSVFSDKVPADNSKHIGIELEFVSKSDSDMIASLLTSKLLWKYVTLKTDGSVKANKEYPYSHELCILAKEEEVTTILHKVCTVLKIAKCAVNKTCGMHVHLDMRERIKEVVFANLVCAQPFLYAMNPPSRQESINGNTYCAFTKSKVFNPRMNRYSGINAAAYNKHLTIEVRIHAGTILYEKIANWVDLLLKIVNKPEALKRSPGTLTSFVKKFELTMNQAEYIVNRIKQFKDNVQLEEAA